MASLVAKTSKSGTRARYLLAGAFLLAGTASAQSIDEERQALAVAKAQSIAANERAAVLERQAAAQQNEADKTRAEAAAVAARIQSAEADLDAGEARIRLIEQLRSEQRARLAARQKPAVQVVAALQTIASRPPLLSIVQPGSTRDLVRVQALLGAMLPVVRQRTAGLRVEILRGKQLRGDADRAQALLAGSQRRLRGEQQRLAQIEARHRASSARFADGALAEQDRAIALGEKARDIVDLMGDLGIAAQVRNRLESLPGPTLRPIRPGEARGVPLELSDSASNSLPYRLPVNGTVVAGLGEVSNAGVRARGLTISTRGGAQVVAPSLGRILFAGPYRGFGKIIIIDHGHNWTTLVTSLDALGVRVGDNVHQGSPIGRAGIDHPTITVELRHGSRLIDIASIVG